MRRYAHLIVVIVYVAFVLLMLSMMSSCTTTQYVPIESVRVDTMHHYTHKVDSVLQLDSIYIKEYLKGDTLYIDRIKYRNIERIKMLTDTLYINRTDSVAVPYPIERKLSKWERTKQEVGGIAIGVALVGIAIAIVWLIKKYRK